MWPFKTLAKRKWEVAFAVDHVNFRWETTFASDSPEVQENIRQNILHGGIYNGKGIMPNKVHIGNDHGDIRTFNVKWPFADLVPE